MMKKIYDGINVIAKYDDAVIKKNVTINNIYLPAIGYHEVYIRYKGAYKELDISPNRSKTPDITKIIAEFIREVDLGYKTGKYANAISKASDLEKAINPFIEAFNYTTDSESAFMLFTLCKDTKLTKSQFLHDIRRCIEEEEKFELNTLKEQLLEVAIKIPFYSEDMQFDFYLLPFQDGLLELYDVIHWAENYKTYMENREFYDWCISGEGEDETEFESANWYWNDVYEEYKKLGGKWNYEEQKKNC